MQIKHPFQFGIVNVRAVVAVALCLMGASFGWLSLAATPSSGTLTTSSGPLTYTSGPFNVPNPTPLIEVDSGPECSGSTQPCDDYALTVQLPAGYAAANPNAVVKVTLSWTDTGSGKSDYDLYIFKGSPPPTRNGSESADAQSSSSNNPEIANITLSNPALFTDNGSSQKYTITAVPYTPTGETVNVRIELVQGAAGGGGGGGGGNFGGADTSVPGQPRYQIFYAPAGSTAESSSGEFNIGYNPHTSRIMVMNSGPVWRITPSEVVNAANPECCEGLWEDVSPITTETGLDPILWTDQLTGRTVASNFTGGANALYAYTDSDGTPTTTQPTGWTEVGLGTGNGGADHETIGSGPYPAGLTALGTPVNQGHAVYYCSQDIVGPAACYRSDTLGASWGPLITLPYNGNTDTCGGLHGHLHVAPDGTVWLPVNQCSGQQGGAFSTDGGITWTEFQVPSTLAGGNPVTGKSQAQGADPSIAIDANSRIYYAYVNNQAGGTEGHARVAVGALGGCTINPITGGRSGCTITWGPDVDLGRAATNGDKGIINAAEIEAVGGDSGRAAVGFLGTNVSGDYQAGTFPGVWYPFISTTYDNGAHWVTVNATPNDPVQRATGVWQQGGSGQNGDRNLLDFTEITVDSKGRALYGFSDGCVTQACIEGTAGNDKVAFMRVARQSGGKSLYASNDANTDLPGGLAHSPKPPCLSGTRSASESLLNWKVPDNGGSDIVNYKIYRGTAPGNEVLIGQTGNAVPNYRDQTPPNNAHLYYKVSAINGVGEGTLSNEIDLVTSVPQPLQSACVVPGLTILTDPAGDTSAVLGVLGTPAPPGSDLLSFQLAQPYQSDGIPRLVFTINTDPNPTGIEPAGWSAYVAMSFANGTNTTYKGVHMTFTPSSGTTPVFESYTPGGNNSGGVDGRFVTPGSQIPAEAGSNYNATTGTITIIVKASDLGLAIGNTINGFVSGTSQSSDPANLGAGATALYDQMPDSLAFAGSYTLPLTGTCSAPGWVSRLTHGIAGDFDILLPTSGNPAIEPRRGSSNGTYTLIYAINGIAAVPGTVSGFTGLASVGTPTIGPNPDQISIPVTPLTGSPPSHATVTLGGVQDTVGNTLNNLTVRMDVLVGDVNADGFVNAGDTVVTKNHSGQAVTTSDFRADVNVDGFIDAIDVSLVKSKSGTALPAATPASQPQKQPSSVKRKSQNTIRSASE